MPYLVPKFPHEKWQEDLPLKARLVKMNNLVIKRGLGLKVEVALNDQI